jgi:hypothetical protein
MVNPAPPVGGAGHLIQIAKHLLQHILVGIMIFPPANVADADDASDIRGPTGLRLEHRIVNPYGN